MTELQGHAARGGVEDLLPRRRARLVPRRPRPGGPAGGPGLHRQRAASWARRSSPCTRASPASPDRATAKYASPVDVGPGGQGQPRHHVRRLPLGLRRRGTPTSGPTPRSPTTGASTGSSRRAARRASAPGGNVVAELGSTWRLVMAQPDRGRPRGRQAARRTSARTTSRGAPTRSGTAHRRTRSRRSGPFEISEELQARYGYPALTPEVKAKILGLNSCRLYGVKPLPKACRIPPDQVEQARISSPGREPHLRTRDPGAGVRRGRRRAVPSSPAAVDTENFAVALR